MKKGSITVYLSLVLLLFIGLIGALLESASVQVAKNCKRADVNRGMECSFAEYQKELLQEYGIFGLEGTYETGAYEEAKVLDRIRWYAGGNLTQEISGIRFLTEEGGAPFFRQATEYMKAKIPVDLPRLTEEKGQWETQKGKEKGIVETETQSERKLDEILAEEKTDLEKEENPITHMKQIKSKGLLELVMPREQQISEKCLKKEEMLQGRTVNKGYGRFSERQEKLDEILFKEYLLEKFPPMTETKGGGALDYELEYILYGEPQDRENLKKTVQAIQKLRFVADYLYIQGDGEMRAEAEGMAAALCTALAVPVATEAAAQLILLAWAYGETIMDLRTLLRGGKVPVVKTKATWQLQLSQLLKLGTEEDRLEGQDFGEGQTYKGYLRAVLYLKERKELPWRALDMIEGNMKGRLGQSFFRSDFCISDLQIKTKAMLPRGIRYTFETEYGYR